MKKKLENVKTTEMTMEMNSDRWGDTYYEYRFRSGELIMPEDIVVKKKVCTPETIEEYKELHCLSDKNILDLLLKVAVKL
jgi:hypothetical protein